MHGKTQVRDRQETEVVPDNGVWVLRESSDHAISAAAYSVTNETPIRPRTAARSAEGAERTGASHRNR